MNSNTKANIFGILALLAVSAACLLVKQSVRMECADYHCKHVRN